MTVEVVVINGFPDAWNEDLRGRLSEGGSRRSQNGASCSVLELSKVMETHATRNQSVVRCKSERLESDSHTTLSSVSSKNTTRTSSQTSLRFGEESCGLPVSRVVYLVWELGAGERCMRGLMI